MTCLILVAAAILLVGIAVGLTLAVFFNRGASADITRLHSLVICVNALPNFRAIQFIGKDGDDLIEFDFGTSAYILRRLGDDFVFGYSISEYPDGAHPSHPSWTYTEGPYGFLALFFDKLWQHAALHREIGRTELL